MNLLKVLGSFISFVSKPIGTAFSKGLETVVGKTVEYTMDKYLNEANQEKHKSKESESIVIQNHVFINNQDLNANSLSAKQWHLGRMVVCINNRSVFHRLDSLISNELSKFNDILIVNPAQEFIEEDIVEIGSIPIILIDISGNSALKCDFVTKNIIPGVNDIATLSLQYKNIFMGDRAQFVYEVCDGVITVISILKNITPFCCNTIQTHRERLQLEAELLYDLGYKRISFKEYPDNKGYILELPIGNKEFVFFLPYTYPIEPPEIWVYEGAQSYSIPFANHCWKKEYTLSQIILAIQREE